MMTAEQYNTGDGLVCVADPEGVWIAYVQDWHPVPRAVFLNELDARRFAAAEYADVRFWRFGETWEGE